MVSIFIRNAWEEYKKNAGLIVGAQITYFAVVLCLALISVLPLISAGAGVLFQKDAVYTPELIARLTWPLMAFLLGIAITAAAAVALDTGRIGIYANILRKKETSIKTMFSVAKDKFWASIGSTAIIVLIIGLISFAVMILSAALLVANPIMSPVIIISALSGILLFALLFGLAQQSIVLGNNPAFSAVEESYSLVKREYLKFLAISVFIAAVGFVLTFAGLIGSLTMILVLRPVADVAYTLLYIDIKKGPTTIKEPAAYPASAVSALPAPKTAAKKTRAAAKKTKKANKKKKR